MNGKRDSDPTFTGQGSPMQCNELRFVPDEHVIALLRDSLGIER